MDKSVDQETEDCVPSTYQDILQCDEECSQSQLPVAQPLTDQSEASGMQNPHTIMMDESVVQGRENENKSKQELQSSKDDIDSRTKMKRTRTRKVSPPNRLMLLRSGRAV